MRAINTIVFDLGGVLIDWNPTYLYRKLFDNEEEMTYFLREICAPSWNEQQDAGRPLDEATAWLASRHPEYEDLIRAFYGRWEEMLAGPIQETVQILEHLHQQNNYRLYALTNWSHETFPIAQTRYEFLNRFEGILVSGEEKLIKPDPRIFRLLFARFEIQPEHALFIDDNPKNIEAATQCGMHALQFHSPDQLHAGLAGLGIQTRP
ncbi:MAG: HAD family phosphatase [Haliscomenobacter sp.]|nr:HAD family phosphatase [Haliscomenobacter sp.]